MAQNASDRLNVTSKSDLLDWRTRFERLMRDPTKFLRPASTNTRQWHTSEFGCLCPISTSCLAIWCPCILFSRTHHRTRQNGNMEAFSLVNTTCLLWCGAAALGIQCLPQLMQRADIRQKHNLHGSWASDVICALLCNCCDMVQQEKESQMRESEKTTASEQYSNRMDQMLYTSVAARTREEHQMQRLQPEVSIQTASPSTLSHSVSRGADVTSDHFLSMNESAAHRSSRAKQT